MNLSLNGLNLYLNQKKTPFYRGFLLAYVGLMDIVLHQTWRPNMVSRERLELSTPGLKGPCSNQLSYRPRKPTKTRWWAIEDSNLWPRLRQRRALANWANSPICLSYVFDYITELLKCEELYTYNISRSRRAALPSNTTMTPAEAIVIPAKTSIAKANGLKVDDVISVRPVWGTSIVDSASVLSSATTGWSNSGWAKPLTGVWLLDEVFPEMFGRGVWTGGTTGAWVEGLVSGVDGATSVSSGCGTGWA